MDLGRRCVKVSRLEANERRRKNKCRVKSGRLPEGKGDVDRMVVDVKKKAVENKKR